MHSEIYVWRLGFGLACAVTEHKINRMLQNTQIKAARSQTYNILP